MDELMGIVYTGQSDANLKELTLSRAVAALPVVGRYRIIDFQVSSLVNSGARNVGVITQRNYHSLMDHLGSGKEWNLHTKKDGLFILPPFLTRGNVGVYQGMLDALSSNLGYLRRSRQEYTLITDGHMIYNIDFTDMLAYHIKSDSDITMLYQKATRKGKGTGEHRVYIEMNGQMLTRLEVNPPKPHYQDEYLGVMLLRRELLIAIVERATAEGRHSFMRDVLQRKVNDSSLRVMGYPSPVRAWHIDSIQAYYDFNMEMLRADARATLFDKKQPIYTKVRDDMPTRYGENAQVSNCLIADGGQIDGTVVNSVIFRGVKIAEGAVVRNSILMQDARIQAGAEVDHCVLDKQGVVGPSGRLIGPENFPIVISKNAVVQKV